MLKIGRNLRMAASAPHGFRTFQILLASAFLIGFMVLLVLFIWKISNLNTDLNRVGVAGRIQTQVISLLSDARACELNFSGLALGEEPVPLRKIVDLRKKALFRVDRFFGSGEVKLKSLRLIPVDKVVSSKAKLSQFNLEMVFSDKTTDRTSPFNISILANGERGGDQRFVINSCTVKPNGTEG